MPKHNRSKTPLLHLETFSNNMNTLFKFLFNSDEGLPAEEKLYFRTQKGNVIVSGGSLLMTGCSIVSFDAYFNLLSFAKYAEYAALKRFAFNLEYQGHLKISIIERIIKFCDKTTGKPEFEDNVIKEELVNSENTTAASIVFNEEERREGYIFVQIESLNDSVIYNADFAALQEIKNNIKIGIVICTYKRENYVLSNLNRIQRFIDRNPDFKKKLEVFVIDNGQTLEKSPVECAKIYPNKNTGGSGGFTRGIVEVFQRKEFSHFLLMDDDIAFETEILRKLAALLEHALNPASLCLGGAMLNFDIPSLQYEMGARWEKTHLKSLKHNLNIANKETLLINETDDAPDYNAWWFMCMPVCTVEKFGLPLPLFIKGDDVEYGLRTIKELLLINGIGVWHENFDDKYSPELEYYIKRNEMIINALHNPDVKVGKQLKKLLRSVGKQLVYQRYFAIPNIFRAYYDFLKGPSFLLNTDAEQLHRELRISHPTYLNKQDLKTLGYDIDKMHYYSGNRSKFGHIVHVITLNGYLIPSCFYDKNERKYGRLININTKNPRDFFKCKTAVQFNEKTDTGFVTHQKLREVFIAAIKIFRLSIFMMFGYKRACKKYIADFDSLTHIRTE